MKRTLLALTAGLTLCAALSGADPKKPGKATVEGVSVMVSRKLDEKKYPFSGASTHLSLQLTYPGKQLLGVEPSSTVSEFVDDKGNSLLPKAAFFKPTFSMSRLATDRSSMIVNVFSGIAPGKGANKLRIKGDLVALCGLDEKTTEEKEVVLKMNTEVKIGDFTLKVTQEKPFFGKGGPSFYVKGTKPVISGVSVKDADGKAVEVMPTGSGGFGKDWTSNFSLKDPMKQAKVSVRYFSKDEKVTVPVDLTVGVGL
jgi:hypothetical protein